MLATIKQPLDQGDHLRRPSLDGHGWKLGEVSVATSCQNRRGPFEGQHYWLPTMISKTLALMPSS